MVLIQGDVDAFDDIRRKAGGRCGRSFGIENRQPMAAGSRAIVSRQSRRAVSQGQLTHWRASVSSSPNMRFMFWIAWPAAPLTRLSRAAVIIASVPEAETEIPIWQLLV